MAAVVAGRDADPLGTGEAVNTLAWMIRADYVVYPWLQFELRYDERRVDDDVVRSITPNIHAYLLMNVFMKVEATINVDPDNPAPELQFELFYAF